MNLATVFSMQVYSRGRQHNIINPCGKVYAYWLKGQKLESNLRKMLCQLRALMESVVVHIVLSQGNRPSYTQIHSIPTSRDTTSFLGQSESQALGTTLDICIEGTDTLYKACDNHMVLQMGILSIYYIEVNSWEAWVTFSCWR